MPKYILAIDQGTTSTRAVIFDQNFSIVSINQQELQQFFPRSGWVEHDPDEIWNSTIETAQKAITKANLTAQDVVSIGITNQRETTLVWNKKTGKAIYPAIVWQDRRTAEICDFLKLKNFEPIISQKTGLVLDPYFSATKIAWILDNVEDARKNALSGDLLFGTVDTFLLWRLTGGKIHATDMTNASRTSLFNIHTQSWDQELLDIFNIPAIMLPTVKNCSDKFGTTDSNLFGCEININGIAGDQQAAAIGQACFDPGMLKSTYGTGCFALLNTGKTSIKSNNKLLTTIAYSLEGEVTYALEGSIFVAGAAVQWLRDSLGVLDNAAQSGIMAANSSEFEEIYMVPAFTGLGAPYWAPQARGAIFGLTRDTGPNELARAALEASCYQTRDLLEAMRQDFSSSNHSQTILRVDGGMSASNWTMQFLSDMLNSPVDRPKILETTALGAAYLAGLFIDFYPRPPEFSKNWMLDRRFESEISATQREKKYAGWLACVDKVLKVTS
ncbi:MAG: glycerol kinase [Rhodospirillaceae bacterium]|nr:glycerol kinase [Rhodospirillaceae bacterium]|tara:strand:- start:5875 stop:7374 length:1500 start_codon:yes stop_codon:yes gene_type:complete